MPESNQSRREIQNTRAPLKSGLRFQKSAYYQLLMAKWGNLRLNERDRKLHNSASGAARGMWGSRIPTIRPSRRHSYPVWSRGRKVWVTIGIQIGGLESEQMTR